MLTLFEQITHWMTIGEWESIKNVFTAATTLERYYEIVDFINKHRAKYGYRYREKIIADKEFIEQFGVYDLEYLKKAQRTMAKKLDRIA